MTTSPPPAPLPSHSTGTKAPFTAYALPKGVKRGPVGTVVSFGIHLGIIIAIFWGGAEAILGLGAGGPGPRGGGGGDGGPAAYFTLPATPPPAAIDLPAPPQVALEQIPIPDVKIEDLARIEVPQQQLPISSAPSGTGSGGQGPGTGGGTGTGVGQGTGSAEGPGTGGGGGDNFAATPLGVIIPARCFRGRTDARFWVAADGRVTRVEMDPPPRESGCRREMTDRLMAYRFRAATTKEGQPIASVFLIKLNSGN